MRKLLFSLCLLGAAAFGQASCPATVNATFFGTSVTVQTSACYLQTVVVPMLENAPLPSLVNEGLTSPQLVASQVPAFWQAYCGGVGGSIAIPDCSPLSGTAAPYEAQVLAAANTVPASQWSAATYNLQAPFSILSALQIAVAQSTPPPTPPVGPLVQLPCVVVTPTLTQCYAGPGSTLQNTANGQVVAQNGVQYRAVITSGLMGQTLFFVPLQSTAARKHK